MSYVMKISINIDDISEDKLSFLKNKLLFKKRKNLLILEYFNKNFKNLHFLSVLLSLENINIPYYFEYKKINDKKYILKDEFKILSNKDYELKNKLFIYEIERQINMAQDIIEKKLSSKDILEDASNSFDKVLKIIKENTKIYIYDKNFEQKEIYILKIFEDFSNIKISLIEKFENRFQELKKLKELEKEKVNTFLRFGEIPKDEKSYSFIYSRTEENGVSVFYKNKQGFPIFQNLLQFRGFVDRYFGEHPEYDKDLYILNEYIGKDTFFKGDDDEPLIKECKIINKNIKYDEKILKEYLISYLKENFVNYEKINEERWYFKEYEGIFNKDKKLIYGGYQFFIMKNNLKFKYM